MSEFKREARFIVIKRKHLSAESRVHESLEQELRVWLDKHLIPTSECVVVESDWPEYETVWAMIAARVEGRPTPYQVLEQQVAALRQHKNDYMDAAEGTRRALEAEAQALREELKNRTSECNGLHEMLRQEHDRTEKARDEVAALRARVVVFPDFDNDVIIETFRRNGFLIELGASYSVKGQIAQLLNSLEGLARIKGKAVSEGLLRSACVVIRRQLDGCTNPSEDRDAMQVCDSIEALLGEGKEVGDVPSA